ALPICRPAFQSFSAPIGTSFGYADGFIRDLLFNQPYTTANFEWSENSPSMVSPDTPNTLGHYYSNNNTSEPYQDITSYPFIRTVYSRLNPGAVKKVLRGNKVNGQWLQGYSFAMPAAQELATEKAFGLTSYNDDRITKTVVRDANGVETVAFSDSDGNTLASARSGNEEHPSLESYAMTSKIKEQGFVDIHIPV